MVYLFDSGVAALFYRTDLIEQAGYKKEDMQNITWEKYIEIGKAVKAKTGKAMLTIDPNDLNNKNHDAVCRSMVCKRGWKNCKFSR